VNHAGKQLKTEKLVKQTLIVLAVLGLGVLSWLVGYYRQSIRQAFTLATTRRLESYTELYFPSHASLPERYAPGQSQLVTFVLHNVEGRDMTYNYNVVTSGSITDTYPGQPVGVHAGDTQRVSVKVPIRQTAQHVRVQVEVSTTNQSIHYWIDKE
jgi:type II secretory pathway pseudopilin PulG